MVSISMRWRRPKPSPDVIFEPVPDDWPRWVEAETMAYLLARDPVQRRVFCEPFVIDLDSRGMDPGAGQADRTGAQARARETVCE